MTLEKTQAISALVDALFDDMDDRSGCDTGHIDSETMASWKAQWVDMIASAFAAMKKETT
jgi:hypothetical protein